MNKFECQLCKKKQWIPENGFFVKKRIKNGLNIEFNNLKLNPVYEECKKEINDAKNKIQKIENLDKDPENHIWRVFFSIRGYFAFVWVKMALRIYNKMK